MRILAAFLCFILLVLALPAAAITTIRDTEIESHIKQITGPLFEAAGLNTESVRLIIVQDSSLNAFVAGGQNIFLHTGLIMESVDDPSMLAGVIAHEIGHITGGHLTRKRQDLENASIPATIGYILGIASAAMGAPSGAAAALIGGGQHVAARDFLSHSRSHEESADQTAINLLKKTGYPATGLVDLLRTLNREMAPILKDVDPYSLTHPISTERIAHLESAIVSNPNLSRSMSSHLIKNHKFVTAKLRGFLNDPASQIEQIGTPKSDYEKYQKAIALFKNSQADGAIKLMDNLIASAPSNPFFHELKGQMLYENGRVDGAISSYGKTIELLPKATLPRFQIALALIAAEDEASLKQAIKHLDKVLLSEPKNSLAWRQLGIAYGKNGQLGKSYLALAEEASLIGDEKNAKQMLGLAKQHLPKDSPALLRSEDLLKYLEKSED